MDKSDKYNHKNMEVFRNYQEVIIKNYANRKRDKKNELLWQYKSYNTTDIEDKINYELEINHRDSCSLNFLLLLILLIECY